MRMNTQKHLELFKRKFKIKLEHALKLKLKLGGQNERALLNMNTRPENNYRTKIVDARCVKNAKKKKNETQNTNA